MNDRQHSTVSLLRWYPPAWRERYGDEMAALMEDTLGDRPPRFSFRLSLAWAGLRERGHEAGLIGDEPSASERSRAGSLLVLCAWAAFVLAGSSYTKMSEHFARAMPSGTRAVPQGAIDVVTAAAVVGACSVVMGAVVALPAFGRFMSQGGWVLVRRHFIRAAALSALAAVTLIPLVHWAGYLSQQQRNGGSGWYSLVVVAWALLVAAVVALWTIAALSSARRMTFPSRVLQAEGGLAVVVTAAMTVITGATALWWATVADHAPWFLQGTAAGSPASPVTPNLIVTLALMLVALGVASYGSVRIVRSWSHITSS